MDTSEKSRYFMFSKEDVLRLLQYRIEYNHLFMGKRGTAMQGWKLVARRLGNGSNERHVAKKFSNLINMHNKYNSMLKQNSDYEINWPYFHVMKEAIKMLNQLRSTSNQGDFDSYDEGTEADVTDDQIAEEDQPPNEHNSEEMDIAIKQEMEDDDFYEDEGEADNDASANSLYQKTWHRELVMKLIHLRGVKYAHFFDTKDKTTNNQGWLKIHSDIDFQGMEEKQLRKKWQNMVHRYKTIHETIKQGQQTQQEISWQFYEPVGSVLALRHNQMRYSPRGPLSRKSTDVPAAEPSSSETPNDTSPGSSPRLHDEVNSKLLEPVVTISLANKMLQQTSQRVTRGVYVKGQYAKLESFGDDSDSQVADEVKYPAPKKYKFNASHENVSPDSNKMADLLNYERKRDRILFEQNNNMLKMMKALLQKQGVSVPYEVTVNFSDI